MTRFSHVPSRLRASAAAFCAAISLVALASPSAAAVPGYRPSDREHIVVRTNTDDGALERLRRDAQRDSQSAAALQRYVHTLMLLGGRSGEERYFGLAEQALVAAPAFVRQQLALSEAELLQHRHAFAEAEAVLTRVLETDARHAPARLLRAQVRLHLHAAEAALKDCAHLTLSTDVLTATTCTTQARAALATSFEELQRAYALLSRFIDTLPASADVRSWSAGVAGEVALRLGDRTAAGRWLRVAYEQAPHNHFARLTYADWLLSEGKAADVCALSNLTTSSADLLRLALASCDSAAAARVQLAWREAATRGETAHLRDQARFELVVVGNAQRAHATALRNFALNREVDDALTLAQTAAQVRDAKALAELERWRRERHYIDRRFDRELGAS